MREDENLLWLQNRHYEEPRYGLEQRILAHARTLEQRPSRWKRSLWSELSLPRMQLVYALTLIIGIIVGSSVPSTITSSSYLTEEGTML